MTFKKILIVSLSLSGLLLTACSDDAAESKPQKKAEVPAKAVTDKAKAEAEKTAREAEKAKLETEKTEALKQAEKEKAKVEQNTVEQNTVEQKVVANVTLGGAQLYTAKLCHTCHGADGKTPIMPQYPKVTGQSKEYTLQQIKDIKSGARSNGLSAAMKGIVASVSDEEIEALATWLSTQ
jgi:cytochrome c